MLFDVSGVLAVRAGALLLLVFFDLPLNKLNLQRMKNLFGLCQGQPHYCWGKGIPMELERSPSVHHYPKQAELESAFPISSTNSQARSPVAYCCSRRLTSVRSNFSRLNHRSSRRISSMRSPMTSGPLYRISANISRPYPRE